MKTLLTASAVAMALVAMPAIAQTTTTPPATTTPRSDTTIPAPTTAPSATTPSTTTPSATSPTMTTPSSSSASSTADGKMWYAQTNKEMRASKLIGTAVKNSAGETIGDVNEVLLDNTGKVAAVVIGVGGFLGMGEREVAVAFSSLRMSMDANNNNVITIDATKESLKTAPNWTRTLPPRT